MPITNISSDPETLTLTVVGDYSVSVERLWEAWADPRQLEQFWGPETWPATFLRHDMTPGGRSEYFMTGPDSQISRGWWRFLSVDPGRSFEVEDGFADDEGRPNDQMPTSRINITFESTEEGSRFTMITTFASREQMKQLLEMGMLEGMKSAIGQMDDVLADLKSFAADRLTSASILTDTQIRVSRVVRGTVEQVWQAYHDPDLLRQWALGPEGWTMPVCEIASEVGDDYRYEWENADGSASFGFVGEVLEFEPPRRLVATELMIGMEGPPSVNALTFTPTQAGTLVTLVVTYPSTEARDGALDSGMIDGMESSYARLESKVLDSSST